MEFFFEEIHRAETDKPYVDTAMHNIKYRSHYHEETELVYVVEGSVTLNVEDSSFALVKGDVAIVMPYRIHSLYTVGNSHLYIFKLLCNCYDFASLSLASYRFSSVNCSVPQQKIYQMLMRLVLESGREEEGRKELAMKCASNEVLLAIADLPDNTTSNPERLKVRHRFIHLLNRVNQFLAEHYSDDVYVRDVATACHMSESYFAHTFKSATGKSFNTYLMEYRLEKATHAVNETADTFTTIAITHGFGSVRTFNRCFVAMHGMTPSEMRFKNCRDGISNTPKKHEDFVTN